MSQIKLCAVCIVDTMSTLVSLCITSCIIDVCVCVLMRNVGLVIQHAKENKLGVMQRMTFKVTCRIHTINFVIF